MKEQTQIEYWNSAAKVKKFTTFLDWDLILPLISDDTFIVDYGCGYGRTLDELYTRGFTNSVGFDFAPEMIGRGTREYPELNLQLCHDNRIDIESNTAGLVLLFGVLTCITGNDEQEKLMREIYRVLKPGGLIYINDFLLNSDDRNVSRYNNFQKKYGNYGVFELEEGAVLRHHNEEWIKKLTLDFKTLVNNRVIFNTMNGHLSNGFAYIGRKV